jgi:hypothetical protein
MEPKTIMQYEPVLPANFDGTFRFTNWTDEDFIGTWGSKQYHFPAKTTSPIIIHDQTPLEIQSIRKKFAKDLAEREFFKGNQYTKLLAQERNNDGSARLNSINQAGTYSIETLTPFIQRCLEPLPIARAVVTEIPKEVLEEKLSRNESGELNTEAIDKKTSLKKKALES